VAATSATDVWAVGTSGRLPRGRAHNLIEHWDGSSWKKMPSPSPGAFSSLTGVAAVSPTDAWAVGAWQLTHNGYPACLPKCSFHPLILHWDGTRWRRVFVKFGIPPRPGGFLTGVARISSTKALAVGYNTDPPWTILTAS
jgi:hypothetical protein